ncbi:alpha-hydroxy-acid oxidizing protein [Spirosoma sp. BT702]|uniref:Alpha-hydroxy-acid oxidizing protein n=1 Tax=Spirosoma profusum TaxID=2771354 RepID=A0A927AVI8_9BACT|nr:alpha-hydroxy-acid oxidizing protein [Spirosoma profusum]MBD2705213.1 alpha-hydroxy-acid oxidizing protein [Spirosoma profusum]
MRALDWQRKIYLDGFAGKKPSIPPNFDELEQAAIECMTPAATSYIVGGAGHEHTMQANRHGFNKWQIVPRMLRNVENVDLSVELLGHKLASPVLLSPIGVLEMAHTEADLAVAKAAAATSTPYIFSNQASVSMEACSAVMSDTLRFFQLYWSRSRELVSSFVARAEVCGCQAIVLTLDTTMLGWRARDLAMGHLPFLHGKGLAQYTSDPVFGQLLDEFLLRPPAARPPITPTTLRNLIAAVRKYSSGTFLSKLRSGRAMGAVSLFSSIYTNPTITWEDLSFLRQKTRLPILLKGILHPDDARKAVDYGMDGIIVSNHGGRQVDGALSTIEALPNVVAAVNNQLPVLIDSGIRSGADVIKALALGATAVCLGRPYVYGLALGGQQGVETVIRHLLADIELTLCLSGYKSLSELRPDALRAV